VEGARHTPAYTLVVLQLADDLDVFALLPQHRPDGVHVRRLADEGGEDHVDAVLHAEQEVLDVLLRDGGQVHGGAGEVHALLAAQGAAVLNLAHEEVRTWGERERERENIIKGGRKSPHLRVDLILFNSLIVRAESGLPWPRPYICCYRLIGDVLGYTEHLSPLLSLRMDEFISLHHTLLTLLPPWSLYDLTSHTWLCLV